MVLCKRITGRRRLVPHGAISLIARLLYSVRALLGLKVVTQKVRLQVIYGEESLSPERLFGCERKRKVHATAGDHGIETL
jgi:hypothetical protein